MKNMEVLGHWGHLQRIPSVRRRNIQNVLFIGKIRYAARSRVPSIVGSALECSPVYVRSHAVRSILGPCVFNCMQRVRSQCVQSRDVWLIARNCLRIPTVQAMKRWWLGQYKICGWRGMRSIVPLRLKRTALDHIGRGQDSIFAQFHPFEPQIAPRTYNTLNH